MIFFSLFIHIGGCLGERTSVVLLLVQNEIKYITYILHHPTQQELVIDVNSQDSQALAATALFSC